MPDYAEPNFQSYAVQLTGDAPIGRDRLMQRLLDAGISTRRGIMLAYTEPAYAGCRTPGDLGRSESASANSLLLPLYPQMSDKDVQCVIDALSNVDCDSSS